MSTWWIDYIATLDAADQPLHAGITRKVLQDNLTNQYEQCAYDFTSYHNEGDDTMAHTLSGANAFEAVLDTRFSFPMPVYMGTDGEWRDITVAVNCLCTGAATTGTVRVYLREAHTVAGLHATNGFVDDDAYMSATFDDHAAYTVCSGTIDGGDIRPGYIHDSVGGVAIEVPVVYPVIILKADNAEALYCQGFRFAEEMA